MTFPLKHHPRLILSIIVSFLPACGSTRVDPPPVQPVYDEQTGRLIQLQYDESGNGRVDTWVHLDGTRILRAESDRNEDGRIDRWEHYRPEGAVGKIARIEIASGGHSRITRTEFFVDDVLDQIHEDTDSDGRTDKWETYRGSVLAAVAFDMQRRGTPDRRLVYRGDGTLERIESDVDGDGTFEPAATRGN